MQQFFNLYLHSVTRNVTKEIKPKAIKQELLASITETADKEDYSGLNKEVKNAQRQKRLFL